MTLIKCDKCGHLINSDSPKCPVCGNSIRKRRNNINGEYSKSLFFIIIFAICTLLFLTPFVFQSSNVIWYSSKDGSKSVFSINNGDCFSIVDIPLKGKRAILSSNIVEYISCSNDLNSIKLPKYARVLEETTSIESPSPWWVNLKELSVVKRHRFYSYMPGNNVLVLKNRDKLIAGCQSSTIPNGVSIISSYAFSGSDSLKRIIIPATVNKIEEKAFYLCRNLESVSFAQNSSIRDIEETAFIGCTNLSNIIVSSDNEWVRKNIENQISSGLLFSLFDDECFAEAQREIYEKYGLSLFSNSSSFGIKNNNGKIVVPAIYSHIILSSNGKYANIQGDNNLHGIYDLTSHRDIIPCKYDELEPMDYYLMGYEYPTNFFDNHFGGNYVVAINDSKKGVFDMNGRMVIPIEYNSIDKFEDKFENFYCHREGYVDIYDNSNNCVEVPCDASIACQYGFCLIKREGKWGVVNNLGDLVIPPQYDSIPDQEESTFYGIINDFECFSEGFSQNEIIVQNNGKYGLVSLTGEMILPCEYDHIGSCSAYSDNSYYRWLFKGECDSNSISDDGAWGIFYRNITRFVSTECTYQAPYGPSIGRYGDLIEQIDNITTPL